MDPALQRRPDLPPPVASMTSKLNWLRAGVLGANDGIVSTSALMVGVAGAGTSVAGVLTAGVAAMVAGAFSMGVGEYVSVSSQRDSERAAIRREVALLEANPDGQIDQLAHMYEERGLVVATVVALLLTGVVSARIGASSKRAAMFRVLIGGVIALAATWFIGSLFGTPVH